ncbi:hypothetical protein RUND412_004808 [Rhizina undulata]
MDDFAQTRDTADFFESEITAVLPPTTVDPVNEVPATPTESRGNRGVGRGGGPRGGSYTPRGARAAQADCDTPEQSGGQDVPPTAPTGPAETKVASVNRISSGGIQKEKLSDEALEKRMALGALRAEKREAKYRKAIEDAEAQQKRLDSIKKREQSQSQRRVIVDKERREFDEERQKNAQRKSRTLGTREWDSEKKEEDYNILREGGGRFRRGAYGAVPNNTPPRAMFGNRRRNGPKSQSATETSAYPKPGEAGNTNYPEIETPNTDFNGDPIEPTSPPAGNTAPSTPAAPTATAAPATSVASDAIPDPTTPTVPAAPASPAATPEPTPTSTTPIPTGPSNPTSPNDHPNSNKTSPNARSNPTSQRDRGRGGNASFRGNNFSRRNNFSRGNNSHRGRSNPGPRPITITTTSDSNPGNETNRKELSPLSPAEGTSWAEQVEANTSPVGKA